MRLPTSILIYGRDTALLQTRRLVLESAGFRVETATDSSTVVQTLSSQPVDVSIFCHTLSTDECKTMLASIHTVHPRTKVLLLQASTMGCDPSGADPVISIFDGPGKLIATVRDLIPPASPATMQHSLS